MMKRWGALAGAALGFWCTIQNTVLASPAWFGVSPDNSQEFVLDVIASARKEILLNIYEFRHPLFTKAIIAQINKGITVKILVEGQPYAVRGQTHSPMQPDTRVEVKAVWAAMERSSNKNNKIFIMYSKDEDKRRLVYDHAKYMVIDQARVYVASENFSPSTAPETGKFGNRGWHILVEDKGLVKSITDLFLADSNPREADIVDLSRDSFPPSPGEPSSPRSFPLRDVDSFPRGKGKVAVDSFLTSPNSDKALVDLIDSANESVEIEYASLPSFWRAKKGEFEDNPVFEALISAAKRKVTVHMLLNDDESWGPVKVTSRQNLRAACLAQRIASGYKLPLTAKIIDRKKTQITYIHNKGMIIDNEKVLVSSINGTRNSMKNNRELGVVVEGADAADYYGQVFDFDWENSPKLDFDTCELFRKKPPTDSGDAGANFVTAPGYQYLASIFQFDPS